MKRDLRIDGLKFIMIFLVVLGHIDYHDYGMRVNRAIYAFHMPVFVFLSGYFTSLSVCKEKQVKWLRKTLVIYVLAQLAHFLLLIVMGLIDSKYHHVPFDVSIFSWEVLLNPYIALWYLVCLMLWRWIAWNCLRGVDDVTLLIVSVLLAILAGFIPIDCEFTFQRIFAFFPFFALGLVFKKRDWMSRLDRIPMRYAWVLLLLGLVLASRLPLFMPKMHYGSWMDAFYRFGQSMFGVYLCLLIVRVTRIRAVEPLAKWGTYTLWIYVGHTYLIVMGRELFPHFGISFNLFTALILAAVYCALFMGLAIFFHSRKERDKTHL